MDVKQAIECRRSIRRYRDDAIGPDEVAELLNAARLAPSGCNAQPWRFFPLQDANVLEKLKAERAFQQEFVYEAPLIVVCCGDPRAYEGKYGGEYQVAEGSVPTDPAARKRMFSVVEGQEHLRAVRDVSIASAFLVLRATELGLGTSYVGLINKQVIEELLDIPRHYVMPFVITVGRCDDKPAPRPRRPLEEIVIPGTNLR